MHAVHRRTVDRRVRSKIPGMSAMVPAATVILATRSSSVSTTVSYTTCFMCPQRKESRHVRSGDQGGQATGPPRPIHRFPKVDLRWFLATMPKWAGAIFIYWFVYQMHVSHFSMRKPLHVRSCCHKVVMITTASVCFQADLRALLKYQYTFPVSDTDTRAYISTTNKVLPNITSWLRRPYVSHRNIFLILYTSYIILNE